MDNNLKDILKLAKELTLSNDIDTILQAAKKISEYNNDQNSKYKVENIIPDLYRLDIVTGQPVKCELSSDQEISLNNILTSSVSNLIISPRQCGKTTLLQYSALLKCYNEPNITILITCRRLLESKEIINNIKFLHSMNINHHRSISVISHTDNGISFSNGARIISRACTEDSTRGLAIDYVFIDEACFLSYSKLDAFMRAAMPQLATSIAGKFVIFSTPYTGDGPIYEIYCNPSKYNFTVDKWKPKENIPEIYKQCPKDRYENEFLGEFNTP